MNSKILLDSYAAYVESKELHKEISTNIDECDTIVNPMHSSICGKSIIINLPIESSMDILSSRNEVISRFPINQDIPVVPYSESNYKSHELGEFSGLILNKYMLSDPKYLDIVKSNKFVLGLTEVIDNEITLVGKIISEDRVK